MQNFKHDRPLTNLTYYFFSFLSHLNYLIREKLEEWQNYTDKQSATYQMTLPNRTRKISLYKDLDIMATMRLTLYDDHSLSFTADGEPCDLAVTLATVILERPEFNEIYDDAQKVIAHYLSENN